MALGQPRQQYDRDACVAVPQVHRLLERAPKGLLLLLALPRAAGNAYNSSAYAPLDGVVQAVRPAAGFAYDVKVTARFRKPAVYRVKSESDLQPGRRPRDGLLLQPCSSGLQWRLRDMEGDDAVLEHVETNCTVGDAVDGGRSDSLRYADETVADRAVGFNVF